MDDSFVDEDIEVTLPSTPSFEYLYVHLSDVSPGLHIFSVSVTPLSEICRVKETCASPSTASQCPSSSILLGMVFESSIFY